MLGACLSRVTRALGPCRFKDECKNYNPVSFVCKSDNEAMMSYGCVKEFLEKEK